jgi:release factor glutamine methyltransferase
MTDINKEIKWLLKEKYFNKPNKKFLKDIERLKKGEPLDYVIGFTNFLGCKIDLSKKPLIPRPETEFWTEKAIKDILMFCRISECNSVKVLDVFSGSGCIGLAIFKNVKNAEVVFADNDKNCIFQIKKNIKLNIPLIRANKGYEKRRKSVVVKSNVFDNVKGKFDYIFANPPYVSEKNKEKVQKSVLKYEPHNALFAGKDGFLYIKKFLKQARSHLNLGGKIFMEFSPEQKKEIEKMIKEFDYKTFKFYKDQYGKYRWVMVL